jgi:hypothetical protein
MHRQYGQTIIWEAVESKERLDREEKKFTMKISCGREIQTGTGGDTAKTQAHPAEPPQRKPSQRERAATRFKTKLVEETVYGIYR